METIVRAIRNVQKGSKGFSKKVLNKFIYSYGIHMSSHLTFILEISSKNLFPNTRSKLFKEML